jgi:molecular chaperone DnaK (HSP70)
VTFELDASGILRVRARDILTNMEQRAALAIVGTIPDDELEDARERIRELTR